MLINLLRSGLGPKEIVFYGIVMLFALTLSFSIHEFMHAFVADWLGDSTPRNMGRLTLNPVAHMDITGTLLLLLAGFGWGKPVMYNPSNLHRFKSRRLMNIMVHLAGVTGNFILALITAIIATLIACFSGIGLYDLLNVSSGNAPIALVALCLAFYYTSEFSLMLLAFNLLPIPPLDGFHVLQELLPYRVRRQEWYRKFEMFSPFAIWILFLLSYSGHLNILETVIGWIQTPFALAINGICYLISLPFA
jgi:Zn-dependent protease